MSYGIVRVQKMTSGSVKGIEIHDRREKDKSHTNPDIDFSKSGQNYDLHPAQNGNFYQAVKERIDQLELKRAVRKDAVVMAQVLVTSDSGFFTSLADRTADRRMNASHEVYAGGLPFTESEIQRAGIGKDATREFFQKAYDFLADRYGRENVISATVHMDEKTPHMHFNFVPVTEDGRLSAKDVLSRQRLIEQQTAFYEQVGKEYGLQRGEPKESGKRRKHLETAEFKEMSQEVTEARRTLETVKGELKSMQEQKAALEGEISALEGQRADGAQKAAEARRTLETVKGEVKSMQERKTALEGEISALEDKKDTLTAAEIGEIKAERGFLGGLKGVSYREWEQVKATAVKVDSIGRERDEALLKAEKAGAALTNLQKQYDVLDKFFQLVKRHFPEVCDRVREWILTKKEPKLPERKEPEKTISLAETMAKARAQRSLERPERSKPKSKGMER